MKNIVEPEMLDHIESLIQTFLFSFFNADAQVKRFFSEIEMDYTLGNNEFENFFLKHYVFHLSFVTFDTNRK